MADSLMNRRPWVQAVVFAAVPVAVSVLLSRQLLGVSMGITGPLVDGLLIAGLLLLVSLWSKGARQLFAAGAVLTVAFSSANAIKLAFLSMPLTASDLSGGAALLKVLDGWRFFSALGLMTLFACAAVWALWPRRGRAHLVILFPLYFLGIWGAGAVITRVAPSHSEGLPGVQAFGGAVTLAVNIHRTLEGNSAAEGALANALAVSQLQLPGRAVAEQGSRWRNVHLIVIESAWDALELTAYDFSADPWDSRFRAAWERGGRSSTVVPVFGGATANAEFEVLCGLPASRYSIVFENGLTQPMPCLPRVLRESGYETVAHHPYLVEFWNRDEAYQSLGFERYRPNDAFLMDDMDGPYLADGSFLKQVRQDAPSQRRPSLNYVLTLSSHYPFERNAKARPQRISVSPDDGLLEEYANALSYSTEAVMDHIEAVLAEDPDAIVVAVGDHAPVLGVGPDPYEKSGLSLRGASPAAAIPRLARTPLLVVDGRRGAVKVGNLALREVPALVLRLLGDDAPKLPAELLAQAVGSDGGTQTFIGHLLVRSQGTWRLCAAGEKSCEPQRKSHRALVDVRDNLLAGAGNVASARELQVLSTPVQMKIDTGVCRFPVKDFGPRELLRGRPFFPGPDGRSTFWMTLGGPVQGRPQLQIGQEIAGILIAGEQASAQLDSAEFLKVPGKHAVHWSCPGQASVLLGYVEVKPVE
ncbi:MAG: LTA synthase family protein [Gemmatimonadota bacterium]|nr:LTA synthase family protein [Gemmatimonadota bacterium]